MNLREIQELNSKRSEEVNNLLSSLHQKIASAQSELETILLNVQALKAQDKSLKEEVKSLEESLESLKASDQKEINAHNAALAFLEEQSTKLTRLIEETRGEYETLVNDKNKAFEEITLEKNELKVRELALKSKVEAFRKEREEFNFEKRKFEAEKSDYSGII